MKLFKILITSFMVLFPVLESFSQTKVEDIEFELTELNFEGNESFDKTALSAIILNKQTPFWGFKFLNSISSSIGIPPSYFDSNLVVTDKKVLRDFYQDNGFFQVEIFSEYSLDTLDESAILTYKINENKSCDFGIFQVDGLTDIDEDVRAKVLQRIDIDSTQRFTALRVERIKNSMLTILKDNGYMLADITTPVVTIDTAKGITDIYMSIKPGSRFKIKEIRSDIKGEGADAVDKELVKEMIRIKPDDTYSLYELQRAQVRLYRTNLFGSAIVSGLVSDTVNNYVPLNVELDVKPLYEMAPEIILNNRDNTLNLGLGAEFQKKNFLGGARTLSANASFVAQNPAKILENLSVKDTVFFGFADARIGIEQPTLFGKSIRTKVETYITMQKRKAEYNATLWGGKISFDFELPRFTFFNSFSASMNFEQSLYYYRKEYIYEVTKIPDYEARIAAFNWINGIELISYNSDDILRPTEGYNLYLTLEDGNSIPYAISKALKQELRSPAFYKSVITLTGFYPIYNNKQSTFGFKLKSGIIQSYYGDKFGIPLNHRFYLGGTNSVRGWDTRGLVPRRSEFISKVITASDLNDIINEIVPGGFFFFEGSVESRNALTKEIGAAFFVDYGNTWNSYKDVAISDIAVAAGFGMRYYLDFAAFRIDFGLNVYDPGDRSFILDTGRKFWKHTFQFHFGIGEAF